MAAYGAALDAFRHANLEKYESELNRAAREVVGSLEWALKEALRGPFREQLGADDLRALQRPNFHQLLELFDSVATPALAPIRKNRYYDHRERLRNPSEHAATVPTAADVHDALADVGEFLTDYLGHDRSTLPRIASHIRAEQSLERQRGEYLRALRELYEFMDLGGISPRVGSRVVRIRLDALFVALHLSEGREGMIAEEGQEILAHDLPNQKRRSALTTDVVEGRAVLLGDPGSGKSTALRFLAYSIATKHPELAPELHAYTPLLFRATEFADALADNATLGLYEFATRHASDRFGPLFSWALTSGRAIVLIDGLDEISDGRLRTTVRRRIERFASEFPQIRIVVTSRIVGYRTARIAVSFKHFTVEPFDESQVEHFLRKWHEAIAAESSGDPVSRADALWRAIQANAGVRKLAANPLLLTIIALANWRGTRLPTRRVELYQIACETLLENWPLEHRGLRLDTRELERILEPVAFHIMSSTGDNLISEEELLPIVERQMCEVRGVAESEASVLGRDLLRTIEEQTGFFVERGYVDGRRMFGFMHLTFAEYLAARHLAEEWSRGELDLARYVHSARWHEVLLLLAGHVSGWSVSHATNITRELASLGSDHEDLLHRDLLFALEALGDNVNVDRPLLIELTKAAVDSALRAMHPAVLEAFGWRLRRIAVNQPIPALSEASRADATAALCRLQAIVENVRPNARCIKAIVEASISNYPLRWTLADYLARGADDDSGFALISSVYAFPMSIEVAKELENARLDSVGLLDDLRAGRGAEVWLIDTNELLALPPKELVRLALLDQTETVLDFALSLPAGRAHAGSIQEALVEIASTDPDRQVQRAALLVVSQLQATAGRPDKPNRARPPWAKQLVVLARTSPDVEVRTAALQVMALAQWGHKAVMNELSRALADDDTAAISAARFIWQFYGMSDVAFKDDRIIARLLECASRNEPATATAAMLGLLALDRLDAKQAVSLLGAPGLVGDAQDRWGFQTTLRAILDLAVRTQDSSLAVSRIIETIDRTRPIEADYEGLVWVPDVAEFHASSVAQSVEPALRDYANTAAPENRQLAVIAWLLVRPPGTASSEVVHLLADRDPQVARAAANALDEKDVANVVDAQRLVEALKRGIPIEAVGDVTWSSLLAASPLDVKEVAAELADSVRREPGSLARFEVLWDVSGPNASAR